ncbi:uncharacterized protein At4g17910 isoform X2 [Sitophilus oryzae]|nr:uncharacterized protein At4g17910 isoform X2 [Sitophilus oryzae]XP_030755073.1 uncharacterized protein At4g17910 isoform X2 [Sitophilus oryzae]XP_030755074.1 uncharacterized protein At4g17910 isoform X2 [Sitophilus oryzae]XP_030755075.1 uncharacterized protein At4g17910 isoform X2 [Sitophilus oryzae]
MSGDAEDAIETFLLVVPSFFYVVLATTLPAFLPYSSKQLNFTVEFIIIVIPIILNVTVFANISGNILFIISLILFTFVALMLVNTLYKPTSKETKITKPLLNRENFVTNVRSTINLISVVAILAVDFNIFPSRFSKTPRTGFSLMDLGVGLYVFANGIVAPEARGKKDPITNSIKSSIALIIIGILRLVSTKATHYHVSEMEYGIHWNFFITLAVTKILSSCILNIFDVNYIYINAILLTVAHETLLQMFLKSWIFSTDKRTNLISANKEGIVSSVGYVSLYLFSLYFSYSLNKMKTQHNKNKLFFIWIINSLLITCFCTYKFEVSRRLANCGYIAWILFIAISMTWLFYLWDSLKKNSFVNFNLNCCPFILEAINSNGLIFFLVANVLTGLVNLTITTNLVSSMNSLIILIVYMLINCGLASVLYSSKIKLKLL